MRKENRLDNIPADQASSFTSFLKTLSSFTGDLSKLTCPSFLLAPESMLEYSSYWADAPKMLQASALPESAEERFYACIKWFLTALNGSFSSRVPKGEWEKKPFNPILGEQFKCHWEGVDAICEQVSHHPPISAFHIYSNQVSVTGNNGQKTRFSGTQMFVDQVGYCLLELENETYLFSLPSITVNGIWYAAPYVELCGNSFVQSSTGFFASIEYSTKGWIYGEYHHFKATIQHNTLKTPTIIEGQWTSQSTISRHNTNQELFVDMNNIEKQTPKVNEEEQGELESRRVWNKVAEALKSKDYALASTEKSIIENKQRQELKERKEKQQEWKPFYFVQTELDSLEQLKKEMMKNAGCDMQQIQSPVWTFKNH